MKTLTYAIRFLLRSKAYTLINLLGLAFSLACSIILIRYLHREWTVDTHCVDRERIVIPIRDIQVTTSISTTAYCDTTFIPDNQIVRRAPLTFRADEKVTYNEQNYMVNFIATDSCFLQMFHYPLVAGTAELSAPDHALITQEYANRLFGKQNPVGKTLTIGKYSFTIRGVILPPTCKSIFQFDMLIHHKGTKGYYVTDTELLQVLPSVDLEAVNKVSNVFRKMKRGRLNHRYEFITVKDFYFNKPKNVKTDQASCLNFGSSDYLNILGIVAVLLLFVGILNFVNLYMVYMMKRNKEYGIKKVFGLQKWPLFVQIWTENVILAFWALMFAWLIVEITQVPVARLMGTEMHYTWFDLQLSLGFLFGLPLVTSVYPYIRYQYMSPITSIRAITTGRQSVVTRMVFLSIQYMVTFALMVFSLYLNNHFRFMLNMPTGFRTERVLEVNLNSNLVVMGGNSEDDTKERFARVEAMYQKLNECPHILSWTTSDNILLEREIMNTYFNDKDEAVECLHFFADENFFKVYDLKLVEGQLPKEAKFTDFSVILNQAAMKAFGYKHLEEAFIRSEKGLKNVMLEDGSIIQEGINLFPVTAVIEDYYPGHITEGIKPMAICFSSLGFGWKTLIHIAEGKEKEVIDYLKNSIKEVYGNDELEYTWMEDQVEAIYNEDRRVATIYTLFALIAIGIACLGLFGISLFDIRRRYREIAIRKAHGAGMKDLYQLLFKKYMIVLCASFVVAIPFSYLLIQQYTADYVVKAPVGIGIFVLALLLVTAISIGTLYWQIRKAANIDPATVMKTE